MGAAVPTIERERCILCGSSDLREIVRTPAFPVFQGCASETAEPLKHPMIWDGCISCGSAQIRRQPVADLVYQSGHASGLGGVWQAHNRAFARFLARNRTGDGLLEIGGGAGHLARLGMEAGSADRWTIAEPNPVDPGDLPPGVDLLRMRLASGALPDIAGRSLVFSHALEHLYAPRDEMLALVDAMDADARLFLAWPILEEWAAAGLPGALNFEHSFFLPLRGLVAFLAGFGFRLIAEEPFPALRTRFLAFERCALPLTLVRPWTNPDASHETVRRFFQGFEQSAARIRAALGEAEGPAFLCPASVYAQFLLAFGLDDERFAAFLDNAPSKQGRRLYGSRLPIQAPAEVFAQADRPTVVLNAGAHDREIANGLRDANPGTRIVHVAKLVA